MTVECYSGGEYLEWPLALIWQGARLEVAAVLDRWRAPGERGFRVRTIDGRIFALRWKEIEQTWIIQPV